MQTLCKPRLGSTLLLLCVCLLFGAERVGAQNTLTVGTSSGAPLDTITVTLTVTNTDSITALQTDVQLPGALQYVANSALVTARSAGHTVQAGVLPGNLLRILLYSASKAVFSGSSGGVVTFRLVLGTTAGQYPLQQVNPQLSNKNAQNVLTAHISGLVTITAPGYFTGTTQLAFGRVAYYALATRQVVIQNRGNMPLVISRIFSNNSYFVITGDTAATVQPGGSFTATVAFRSFRKGTYSGSCIINSNDPALPAAAIPLTATSYAVNELRLQAIAARSGFVAELPVTVNNMDKVTGVQFDLLLPPAATYTGGNVVLSGRQNGHVARVSGIAPRRVRVVAYSPTNTCFTDSAGELLRIPLRIEGFGSINSVLIDSAVIADTAGDNVLSAKYPTNISITAPDINGAATAVLGEASLNDTLHYSYTVFNTGSDTLKISGTYFPNPVFSVATRLPIDIAPGQSGQLQLRFSSATRGTYTTQMQLLNNDPDENPFLVTLSALAYAPNFLSAANITGKLFDTLLLRIDVTNYDTIVAFQADIELAAGFAYIPNSATLSARKGDHTLSVGALGNNKYRVFAYSLTQQPFSGTAGTVVSIRVTAPAVAGTYSVNITGGVLSNRQSQNVLYVSRNGTISLYTIPAAPLLHSPEDNASYLRAAQIFKWLQVVGAERYRLQVARTPDFTLPVTDTLLADTLFSGAPLLHGTQYWWRARAENPAAQGNWSATRTFTTLGVPAAVAPVQPINGARRVPVNALLLWRKPAARDLVTRYTCMVSADTTNAPLLLDSAVADTFRTVLLANSTTYYWRASAANEAGMGPYCPWQHFTTVPLALPAPGNLAAANTGARRVRLTWSDNSTNETGFTILRKAGDSSSANPLLPIDTVSAGVTAYTDTTAEPATQYSYTVAAFSADTISGYSNYAVITTLTGVGCGNTPLPNSCYLSANYPNPFNPETEFSFGISTAGSVTVTVSGISGELTKVLFAGELAPGTYHAAWDGKASNGLPAPSGIYFIRLQTAGTTLVCKAVLAR